MCVLAVVCCVLGSVVGVCCLLRVVWLFAVCLVGVVVCWLLDAGCCVWVVVCCLLFIVCCLHFAVLLFMVCCVVFVV